MIIEHACKSMNPQLCRIGCIALKNVTVRSDKRITIDEHRELRVFYPCEKEISNAVTRQ